MMYQGKLGVEEIAFVDEGIRMMNQREYNFIPSLVSNFRRSRIRRVSRQRSGGRIHKGDDII